MNKPIISAIAAIGAHNRELGGGNKILWDIPRDQAWFEEKTTRHAVIMGRKTFEQIDKIPLSNRTNIVITSQTGLDTPGFIFVQTIDEALEKAREIEQEEIFIVGGGQIYALALPFTNRLYLTLIDGDFPTSDAFFPDYGDFNKVIYEKYVDERGEGGFQYSFTVRER
jgi:dihydrofolate reductase